MLAVGTLCGTAALTNSLVALVSPELAAGVFPIMVAALCEVWS